MVLNAGSSFNQLMTPFLPTYPSARELAPNSPVQSTPHAAAIALRWPVAVLGVPFSPLTQADTIARIAAMVASRRPHQIVTANVDFLVQSLHDRELRRIMLEADLVLCDGAPVRWASHLLGNPLPERVAGADLVPALLEAAEENGHRIFLLGAAPGVAAQAVDRIRQRWPHTVVAGHFSPPVANLLEMDHDEIVRQIRKAKPDLLLVSFGCPKQEKWISMHLQNLGVPVVIGVGATIDFLAGRVSRAPPWMRRSGLEWLFRLLQEPARLHLRYRANLREFVPAVARQLRALRRRSQSETTSAPVLHFHGGVVEVRANPHLTRGALDQHARFWRVALPMDLSCICDLSPVRAIDSTGLALLLDWRRRVRAGGGRLILLQPSRVVRDALAASALEEDFLIAAHPVEAHQWLAGTRDEPPVSCDTNAGFIRWHGDITAPDANLVSRLTLQYLFALGIHRPAVVIDLSDVRYIDSTVAGLMLRLKLAVQAQFGYEALYIGIRPTVRNVLRCSGLATQLVPAR